MTSGTLKRWRVVHSWSSVVATLFLLMLCITGLPLIFGEEIAHGSVPEPVLAAKRAGDGRNTLDELTVEARSRYPGLAILSIGLEEEDETIVVTLAPSWAAARSDPRSIRSVTFDEKMGQVVATHDASWPAKHSDRSAFLNLMYRLHVDLFGGFPGQLLLGLIGSLFVIAIASGVVLYSPFMRHMPFGTLRIERSRRIRWLDLHNLLGIVATAWMTGVGVTGVINELSVPMFATWRANTVNQMTAPWHGKPPIAQAELASIDNAVATAQRALPGMSVNSAIYPGSALGNPHHYFIWTHGKSPLTSQLLTPVLVDARTGKLTAVVQMPWYLRALELSRPLHFGDYGGLPLKIIWALLDLVTIVVLGSGLYLWIARHRRERVAPVREGLHGASPVMKPAE